MISQAGPSKAGVRIHPHLTHGRTGRSAGLSGQDCWSWRARKPVVRVSLLRDGYVTEATTTMSEFVAAGQQFGVDSRDVGFSGWADRDEPPSADIDIESAEV